MSERTASQSGFQQLGQKSGRFYAWFALIAGGFLFGLYGILRVLIEGTVALGISSQVSWGILISTYVFFALLSTGICIGVTSLATVFGIKKYEPLVKRGVLLSLFTLAAGGVIILSGLGQPFRAIPQMVLSPNPESAMWWMIVLYGIYGLALVFEFAIIEWKPGVGKRVKLGVGSLALVAPLLAGGMLGVIFGTAEARPYYGGMFAPVYLLSTAVLSGVALVAAITVIERKLSASPQKVVDIELVTETLAKYLGIMTGAALLLTTLRYLYGLTATDESLVLAHQEMLLSGHGLWTVGLAVIVGLVIPFALMAYPKTRTMGGVLGASVLVLVGMFASRLEFVMGGQVAALTPDNFHEYPITSYTPSLPEFAIIVAGVALFALLYTVSRELFDLNEIAHQKEHRMKDTETVTDGGQDNE